MMMETLEQLLGRLPSRQRDARIVQVDLTDLLGEGWVMSYREPSLTDLCAAGDSQVLAEWRRLLPEIPHDLAATLELIARLHVSPPATETAIGVFYARVLERLDPTVAVQVIRRIADVLANEYRLGEFESAVAEKKKPSARGRTR